MEARQEHGGNSQDHRQAGAQGLREGETAPDPILAELRAGWREDLKRTNWFQYADTDPPAVSSALRRETAREPLTMRHVIQKTADYANLPSEAITGHTQRDNILWWRRLTTKLIFDLFPYTTRGRIAAALSRDPSTVDHSRKKAEWWYENDQEFKQAYHAILAEIQDLA